MDVKRETHKFRTKGGLKSFDFRTVNGKVPLINAMGKIRLNEPRFAAKILATISAMETARGNAKRPEKVTPHRLEITGWRELTTPEFETWLESAEQRTDLHIGKKPVEKTVLADGLEFDVRPKSRQVEQDAEKDDLRRRLAEAEAKLKAAESIKAEAQAKPEAKPKAEPEKEAETTATTETAAAEKPKRKRPVRRAKAEKEGGEE